LDPGAYQSTQEDLVTAVSGSAAHHVAQAEISDLPDDFLTASRPAVNIEKRPAAVEVTTPPAGQPHVEGDPAFPFAFQSAMPGPTPDEGLLIQTMYVSLYIPLLSLIVFSSSSRSLFGQDGPGHTQDSMETTSIIPSKRIRDDDGSETRHLRSFTAGRRKSRFRPFRLRHKMDTSTQRPFTSEESRFPDSKVT
jgi:hypothetical protein